MMNKPISKIEFLRESPIFMEQISEGLRLYPWFQPEPDQLKLHHLLHRMLLINGGNVYVDFYYASLTQEEKSSFRHALKEEEKEVLNKLEISEDAIYYLIDESMLDFFFRITIDELLFSTFYFTNLKVSVWGNYNMNWPIFAQDEESLEWCRNLCYDK